MAHRVRGGWVRAGMGEREPSKEPEDLQVEQEEGPPEEKSIAEADRPEDL